MLRIVISGWLIIMAIAGCTATTTVRADNPEELPQSTTVQPTPVPPNHINLMGMEFEDIPIPNELNLDEDQSILINTKAFVGGAVTYTAPVTVESLIRFFNHEMPKKGWEFIASSYARKNVILAFSKANRNCLIYINIPGDWANNTRVQVWLGKTSGTHK
ncbi:lipoprotein [Candidatus Magnetobacterium bavaricum]|uniref:Lipoprotein n=1 Tax=Candidatus Magnetobacterium bavaricum TaxID=29290 RepID=A0A0F3GLX0_9BACT|nr:lipoprotein [Candidatus Magnetobacterium bavaricum]